MMQVRMTPADDERSVYVGKAASLSFLQLLRDTVTQHIGPSQFSHHAKTEDMLETESPHSVPSSTVDDRLRVTRKEAFVRVYHAAVSCTFSSFHYTVLPRLT